MPIIPKAEILAEIKRAWASAARGEHASGADTLRRVLRLLDGNPEYRLLQAHTMRALAEILQGMGDLAGAQETRLDVQCLLDSSDGGAEASSDREQERLLRVLMLVDLGRGFEAAGNYPRACELWREAYAFVSRLPQPVDPGLEAVTCLNAGVAASYDGESELAKSLFQRALDAAQRGSDHQLAELARLNLETGQWATDAPIGPVRLPSAGDRRNRLIYVLKLFCSFARSNREQAAWQLLEREARLADPGQHPLLHVELFAWLALMRRRMQRPPDEVVAAAEQAVGCLERVTHQLSPLGMETPDLRRSAELGYRVLAAALLGQGKHAEAFQAMERSRARRLGTQQMLEVEERLSQVVPAREVALWKGLREEVRRRTARCLYSERESRWRNLVFVSAASQGLALATAPLIHGYSLPEPDPAQASCKPEPVVEIQSEFAHLSRGLGERYSANLKTAPLPLVTLAQLQSALRPGEVLVETLQAVDELLTLVVTPEATYSCSHPLWIHGGVDKIDHLVETCRVGLRSRQVAKARVDEWLEHIGRAVLEPVLPYLGSAETILWAPAGSLGNVPLAAFRIDNHYVAERWRTVQLPIGSMAAWIRHEDRTGRLLALGNPDGSLPNAEQEVRAVERKYPGRVAFGPAASTDYLRQHAAQAALLHLACHGVFDKDYPDFSLLALAPADSTGTGLLFASDVSSFRLDAGLVVLSACQTGLVGVTDHDDIGGLAVAFLAGGADSVVAALWSVEDEATGALMEAFYAQLPSQPKAEALRCACLALMHTERFSHPSCWSPFVLMGDWRARIVPAGRDETAQAAQGISDEPPPRGPGRARGEPAARDDSGLDEYLQSRKAVHAEPQTLTAASSTGQASPPKQTGGGIHPLVSRCLQSVYSEQPESRQWDSDPEFRKVLAPLNSGDNLAAAAQAEILVARYPDFDTLYDWWATALLRQEAFDAAGEVARRGLARARSKYALCDLLGQIAWRTHDLAEAVYWWSQGVHCQETVDHYGDTVGCYLHLHYLADGLGLPDCASAFLLRVDCIRSGQIRLNAQSAASLVALAQSEPALAGPVRVVLRELVARCVLPQHGTAPSAEVARLIRQLEKRDDLALSLEDIVETVKRLGELGDPAAIPALIPATGDIRLEVHLAAKHALERIKRANA